LTPECDLELIQSPDLHGTQLLRALDLTTLQCLEDSTVSRSSMGVPDLLGDLLVGVALSRKLQGLSSLEPGLCE
jgi:hypothetical protein